MRGVVRKSKFGNLCKRRLEDIYSGLTINSLIYLNMQKQKGWVCTLICMHSKMEMPQPLMLLSALSCRAGSESTWGHVSVHLDKQCAK